MDIERFKVERWLNAYELGARYNLAETDAKPFTLGELLSLGDERHLKDALTDVLLGYNPTTGSEALRSAIAGQYRNVSACEVLVTAGAIEANFLLANVLVKPGDTIVVQSPAYQALYSVASYRGARVKHWVLSPQQGFKPDLDKLASLLGEDTRLLVLNNPHNPTGASLGRAEMEVILRWAEEKDFWVLSDEVYHALFLENSGVSPPARDLSPRAISIGSTSKMFGLSGLRLGWIAGAGEILEACWSWKDYTSISISPVSDFLARVALSEAPKIFRRTKEIARQNLDLLISWIEASQGRVRLQRPDAGLVCFPFFDILMPTEEFCRRLYNERGVLLVPGECFGMPGHIRFGYGGECDTFRSGLVELSAFMKDLFG